MSAAARMAYSGSVAGPAGAISRSQAERSLRSTNSALHAQYEMKRINHEEAYSLDGACTNWAEEFFSRMRRAEAGHHHHLAGPYLLRYAQEASWREDHRRISNGEQANMISELAMKRGPSVDFCGYWQRN